MTRRKAKVIKLTEDSALKLQGAVNFLLSQDLQLLRPGNWLLSEWTMTVGAWNEGLREIAAAIEHHSQELKSRRKSCEE
jgi:hypothetical protein